MNEYFSEFLNKYPSVRDSRIIRLGFEIADKAHENQKRKSGEPYIIHPLAVASIVLDLGMDENTVAAALLHDVVEDTEYTLEEIEALFNKDVARMVDGVTKLTRMHNKSKEEQKAETVRKMLLATNNDIRVMIIKLADRLHNMRTMEYQSGPKQIEKASETLELYAPLAQRLGMTRLAGELEDLSFRYTNPKQYFAIHAKLNATKTAREQHIESLISDVKKEMDKFAINARVEGRLKNIYSIYRKMTEQNKSFEELFDIVALRVIVDTEYACYNALGAIHLHWKPIPNRFKDYVALPKQGVYQSLHTTVLGADGSPFEVQIRTNEMHEVAEYGIAAHWKYKKEMDESISEESFGEKLVWLHEIIEWQQELSDSREFMETLKVDMMSDNVFVFTPKGDVKDFIKGSTPLDFAYSIHSDIGNRCIGAKVNSRLVPLNYELQTGDIVEIITSMSRKGPSRDWLKFVHTALARNKIRLWFRRELKEENIKAGREILREAAEENGFTLEELLTKDALEPIFDRYSLNSVDDMLASFGYGALSIGQVLSRLLYQAKLHRKLGQHAEEHDPVLIAKGHEDQPIRLSKCCNAIPGDEIVGYITQGRGITVHRVDCKNLRNKRDFPDERKVEVEWGLPGETKYAVDIQIEATDRTGILYDITGVLSGEDIDMTLLNARLNRDHSSCVMTIKMQVSGLVQLNGIMTKIGKIEGVNSVYRHNAT